MSRRVQGVVFYLIALGLTLGLAVVEPITGEGLLILSMTTPAVGMLVMMLVLTRDGYRRSGWAELGMGHLGLRVLPWSVLVPFGAVLSAYALASLVHDVVWTVGTDLVPLLVSNIVIISGFALFEEIGWRGYLLPRLTPNGGPFGAAIVGLMHGVWHLPLIVLTTAYNPVGNRWVVVPIFLGVLTVAGIFYGWLREKSGSLWPVVLAHGTFNTVLGVAGDASRGQDENTFAYLAGETGVFTLLAVTVVAVLLVRRTAWGRTDRAPVGRPAGPSVVRAADDTVVPQ